MANTFLLEIVTPEKQFFTGQVESLVLPASDGSMGVQAGHEPVVVAIEPGEARYKADGEWHDLVVTQGFAEIMSDYAILLVSAAENAEDIDEARAERAKERAEERLRQKGSRAEYYNSKAALARATARLSAARQHHHH
ncbi:ATP synthase F1 subunit epsilon [uncultured Gemmiger sp.]|uniref:ATP synthase F1 subunit epsilon n=1 Tax=uncultured Gemmiger sp. TaxID=1623490 RepID=UPI0025CE4D04|nr:ATP synthase F1 subunit epsilon [uncultured Gemmiger sp.]